ncbi:cytochrome c oxidase subunit 7A-like [Cochliomyia hominivorax]
MFRLLRPVKHTFLTKKLMLNNFNRQQQTQCGSKGKLPAKLKRMQKVFQAKNDLPVFLKGGNKDKILYYTTLGLSGLGLLLNVALFAGYIID